MSARTADYLLENSIFLQLFRVIFYFYEFPNTLPIGITSVEKNLTRNTINKFLSTALIRLYFESKINFNNLDKKLDNTKG